MDNNQQVENTENPSIESTNSESSQQVNHPEYNQLLKEYTETLKNQEAVPQIEDNSNSAIPTSTDSGNQIGKSGKKFDIFKYTFFVSLILFLTVSSVIAFILFNKGKNQRTDLTGNSVLQNNTQPTNIVRFCELNGKKYQEGELFKAADNCNSCSCKADGSIECTEKDCINTKADAASPSASPVAGIKSYTDTKFEFKYPPELIVTKLDSGLIEAKFETKPTNIKLSNEKLIYFTVKQAKTTEDVEEWVKSQTGSNYNDPDRYTKFSINKQTTYYYFVPDKNSTDKGTFNYLIIKDKNYILFSSNDTNYLKDEQYKAILNSVKLK